MKVIAVIGWGTADTEALMGTIARIKFLFIQDLMQGN